MGFITQPTGTTTTTTGNNSAGSFSIGFSIMGALSGSLAAFYNAKTDIYKLDSLALTSRYQAGMAERNARQAEKMADDYMKQGFEKIAQVTQAAGQAKSTETVRAAARGVAIGAGSAGEVQESIEKSKDADYYTINANAIRASETARTQAVMFRNKALLLEVDATNAAAFSRTISPSQRGFTSLLTGASNVSMAYLRYGT